MKNHIKKTLKHSFAIGSLAVGAMCASHVMAYSSWTPTEDALPYASKPSKAISGMEIAQALGVNPSSEAQKSVIRSLTESVNEYGFARVALDEKYSTTVWHAERPHSGPFKGMTGLVIQHCNQAPTPACFSAIP